MMLFPHIFASIEMSENDKKALIALVILLVVLFVLIGLIGMAVRKTMNYQARRADTFMHDVTVTHVVQTPHQFRALGRKKNARLYYKQSLIPGGVIAIGVLTWVIYSWVVGSWGENIFASFSDLLFVWDFGNPNYYTDFFGITILKQWPALLHGPFIQVDHIAAYIEVPLIVVGCLGYLLVTQAYISRVLQIEKRSRDVFSKSLEGYKANDIDTSKVPPLPPSD